MVILCVCVSVCVYVHILCINVSLFICPALSHQPNRLGKLAEQVTLGLGFCLLVCVRACVCALHDYDKTCLNLIQCYLVSPSELQQLDFCFVIRVFNCDVLLHHTMTQQHAICCDFITFGGFSPDLMWPKLTKKNGLFFSFSALYIHMFFNILCCGY